MSATVVEAAAACWAMVPGSAVPGNRTDVPKNLSELTGELSVTTKSATGACVCNQASAWVRLLTPIFANKVLSWLRTVWLLLPNCRASALLLAPVRNACSKARSMRVSGLGMANAWAARGATPPALGRTGDVREARPLASVSGADACLSARQGFGEESCSMFRGLQPGINARAGFPGRLSESG